MSRRRIKIIKNRTDNPAPYESVRDRILAGIMDSAGSVLLILSGIIIGGELLESYSMTPLYIVLLLAAVVIFSTVNNRAADLILGFSAAAVIVYMIVVRDSIPASVSMNGSACLINEYIQKWNYYFDTVYSFPYYGSEGVSAFCFAATVILVIILHVASGIFRKKIIFAFFPLILITANLLVGLAPGLLGMMCMFSGVLLALNADAGTTGSRKYGFTGYYMTAAMAVIIIILCCTVFGKPANVIVSAHDDVREFQSDIERRIKLWTKYGGLGADGMVTNDTPEYTGEEVMQVSLRGDLYSDDEGRVYENRLNGMYLKGYNSSDYYEGRWLYDDGGFEDFCEDAGLERTECSRRLLGIVNGENATKTDDRRMEIEYKKADNDKAYMPYNTYGQEENEGVHLTEDYRFIRDAGVNKINVIKDFGLLTVSFSVDEGLEGIVSDNAGVFFTSVGNASAGTFENKYSNYVRNNYLEVPDSQKTARIIADELMDRYAYPDVEQDMYSYVGDDYIYDKNGYRHTMARAVAEYLENNARYSLTPGSNGSEDAIEYFLSESKRGYCVHFASAGVMILRSMGIPARYVTGYAVFPRDFKASKDTDDIKASVKDCAAHAWIEVYMEGRGWMPYEMTPAYSDEEEKLPTQWTAEDIEKRYGRNNNGVSDSNGSTGNNNVNNGNTNNGAPNRRLSGPKDLDKIIMVSCIIFFAVVAFGIISAIVLRHMWDRMDMAYTGKMNDNADYNRVVKKINRNIYFYLIKKRGVKKYYKNDTDYYAALRSVFKYINGKRWSAYADIVRTAAYSDMKVTKEDAGMCMDILSDIRNIK